ncbi:MULTISPECIES: WXG100-like domain-containing protein [Kitasatospora]|uniref:Outer membrane channel protein CpnT-like N-terminal domain-containing protein n=1 Tax=Kitasatospora cystarginea TaxID=58350 RepID=A0ABP5RLQ5_9ACTN
MAIELPDEVVSFLQFIGVNWPNVNEDHVRELASHIRDFADNVDGTHQASTATVRQMSEAYEGQSYEALLAAWTHMSGNHMTELIDACHVVATALDVAADVIVGMKTAAIAELVVLAATFVADQAAAVVTFGAAEAAEILVIKAAEAAVDYLEQQLVQHIIGEVIEKAIDPLVDVVGKAVSGLVYQAAADALGVPVGGVGAGAHFRVDPAVLTRHAETMAQHAQAVAGHADELRTKLAGVTFV